MEAVERRSANGDRKGEVSGNGAGCFFFECSQYGHNLIGEDTPLL